MEEVHARLVLQVGALASDIVHVMRDLVLAATERGAEPVEGVLGDVLRSLELDQVGDDVQARHSLTSIEIDEFHLFLDLGAVHRSLQQ